MMAMIVVPALVTLAITVLRLVGELQHWSKTFFNPAAGGGGALIGISWLIPIFGIYFALKLRGDGFEPTSKGRAVIWPLLGIVINIGATVALFALGLQKASPQTFFLLGGVICYITIAVAFRGWPALGRVLLGYALAARIPVVVVMLVAIFSHWGTHYDVLPPEPPAGLVAMGPLARWFWIGFIPQMTIWIFMTVVAGMLCGGIAYAIAGQKRAA
jgi:hypothetical protein